MIKVAIVFSNLLFANGISRLIDGEDDISIATVIEPGAVDAGDAIVSSGANVALTDITSLYTVFSDDGAAGKIVPIILLDSNCGKDNIAAAIMRKKVAGVLLSGAGPALLKKAVRAVSRGEIWLDRSTVKTILGGMAGNQTPDRVVVLSGREREITELIGRGLRNKEIAQKLNISEPTVKTHVHRIFRKLNIKTRSELITYAIKGNGLGQGRS